MDCKLQIFSSVRYAGKKYYGSGSYDGMRRSSAWRSAWDGLSRKNGPMEGVIQTRESELRKVTDGTDRWL